LKIKADDIDGTVKRIKNIGRKCRAGYPFDSYFIDKKFAESFVKYQKQQTLFTILNAMVLMVALLRIIRFVIIND
jgi:putative ABC transport system permease protein